MRMSVSATVSSLRKWLAVACQVVGAAIVVAVLMWALDPRLRSNLIEGSITGWHQADNPYAGATMLSIWLIVKMDDGRTLPVSSHRRRPPKQGERVLVEERFGYLGSRRYFEASIGVNPN
jgi:hypothetical protein